MSEPALFPDGFLWGAATSSHQVEGDNTGNDWWQWEQQPGHVRDGTRSGSAAEWWAGRAESDLKTAAELGQNAHRLSLEWSRLEPEPGRFDGAAFDRYAEILAAARGAGLATLVTLNHFTLPRWLAERGGWLDRSSVGRFSQFSRRAVERLGELVDLWATLNEPNVLAYMAYGGSRWPPGARSLRACYAALVTMLRAHARARAAMHETDPSCRVGIVLNLPELEGGGRGGPRRRDRWIARAQDWAFSGAMLRALERGELWPPLTTRRKHLPELRGALDWIGVNYYGRYRVVFDPRAGGELFGRRLADQTVHTPWTDWGEIHPPGLTHQLLRVARFGVPIYVTENGVYDNTDAVRPGFIVDHVRAVHAAIQRGADVRGYFHWSLIDNFEWAEGWSTHFGLLALDRATQARRPRESAAVYAAICRANGISR